MANIVKKISAIAMAFTLLGVGAAVVKTVSPESDTTITASAESRDRLSAAHCFPPFFPPIDINNGDIIIDNDSDFPFNWEELVKWY